LNPEPFTKQEAAKSASTKAKLNIVVQNSPLAGPSGVVLGGAGQLVVSDSYANKVFIVSLSGQLKSQYPP
jgi:hypothetical protein